MASKPRKQSQPVLQGPPRERYQHGPLVTIQAPEANAGVFCKANRTPTMIDWMLERQMLGNDPEKARRRHAAGLWLRGAHARVYAGNPQVRLVNEYSQRGSRSTSDEMTEVDVWNWKAFVDALRFLGRYAETVRAVCVDDRLPHVTKRNEIIEGLDLLVEIAP